MSLVGGISVEHRVGGPSVRSGAAERPKSTVGVDLHMCFAVDHVKISPSVPMTKVVRLTGLINERRPGRPCTRGH